MGLTSILFIVAFLAGCLLALFRHPVFGALTYVAMVFIDPPSRWWGQGLPDLRWSLISAGVTLAGIALLHPRKHEVPIGRHLAYQLLVGLLLWGVVQLPWAKDVEAHEAFINYYLKYAVAVYLIYRSVDSLQNLRLLLWVYVLGCAYLAWIAFTSYEGGRFDSFGGSGIGDANAGALTLVTGAMIGASLFLEGSTRVRLALLLLIPFIINSLVMTVSRSGFLALAVGGLAFVWYTPTIYKKRVIALSVLAVVGFVMVTNPFYWARIQTVKYKGEDVTGVDTGGARRNLMVAQVVMFRQHPLGCGHACTEFLSPSYLDEKDLNSDSGTRASHNTFLSMLVDHGIVGAFVYLAFLGWIFVKVRWLFARSEEMPLLIRMVLPGITGALVAVTISDQFVPNVRYEIRYWLLTILMLMLAFSVRAVKEGEAAK